LRSQEKMIIGLTRVYGIVGDLVKIKYFNDEKFKSRNNSWYKTRNYKTI
jgi:hypothetical protein